MEKSNLNNLMKQIQKDRDEMAFSQIFDFFAPKVNAYFIQNRIKFESSEELTQEVLSTVWVKSHLYDSSKSALSTWIFTIARNKKIDFFRKNSKIDFLDCFFHMGPLASYNRPLGPINRCWEACRL